MDLSLQNLEHVGTGYLLGANLYTAEKSLSIQICSIKSYYKVVQNTSVQVC
jgi:hypothetical protein